MGLLVIDGAGVRQLLPMAECIEVMDEALRALAEGAAVQPLRRAVWMPDGTGLIGLMPGYLGRPKALGAKVITVFPGNHGTELDAHQGAVILFNVENGAMQAVIDGTEITAIRTAAVSAVATRRLARDEARTLAILGAGTQARTHLEAMGLVRELSSVRVWSRRHDRAVAFAQRESDRLGLAVEPVAGAREAVRGAAIICTTTSAVEPVLHGAWIDAGAHVNAVGACLPAARELDTDAVRRARLFTDRRESLEHEAGDFLIPRAEGAIGDDHVQGEIGEVLLGRRAGRTAPDQVTLFKSLGLAVEDLAAAHHVRARALANGTGTPVTGGGRRR